MKIPNLFAYYQKDEYIMNKKNINTLRTVELFAGVGGFRLGLEQVKLSDKTYKIVWSNQWEPSTKTQHASDIYCARFGYENHSNEDISTVNSIDIPEHDLPKFSVKPLVLTMGI